MAATTKTQSALIGGPNGDFVLSHSIPLPPEPLEDDQVAVAVKAISLNPVDTKMTGSYHTPGAILGCEFAGVVTAAGSVAAANWNWVSRRNFCSTSFALTPAQELSVRCAVADVAGNPHHSALLLSGLGMSGYTAA